jgi:hypothetical protein
VLTPFFGKKQDKMDKKEQPMRKQHNWSIEEKEGWSTGLSGQRNLTLSIDGLASQPIGRWSTGESTDGKKESGNQRDTPKARHGGGGSIYD